MSDPTSPIPPEPGARATAESSCETSPADDTPESATAAAVEAEALAAERATVEEAVTRPAEGRRQFGAERDRALLLAGLTLVVLLVAGWLGGTALLELRRDVGSLSVRLDAAEASLNRAERSRAAAAVARARASLREVDALLPEELAAAVRLADRNLQQVETQLENPP